MTDFRSWISHESEYNHWIGAIAKDIKGKGWVGLSPNSLRDWMQQQGLPQERIQEVDSLEKFYFLFRKREILGTRIT